MGEKFNDQNYERYQELVAMQVLKLSGIEVMDDPRTIVQIAVDCVEKGHIDEVVAVNEGLMLPDVSGSSP